METPRAHVVHVTAVGGKIFHGERYIGIGRFAEDGPAWPDGAWSVVLEFDNATSIDSPSVAKARFYVAAAPHERIRAGQHFAVYEGPRKVAVVDVRD